MSEVPLKDETVVTISFDGSVFIYSSSTNGAAGKKGNKHRVKKSSTIKWNAAIPWVIRFDPSARPTSAPPLPEEEYRGAAGQPNGGDLSDGAIGYYKYWVAVYYTDGKIYMDDPHVVVDP